MITVATMIWDSNEKSLPFSRCYDEEWVARLYRGFARNLTRPFDFVCFTDRERDLPSAITQEPIQTAVKDYGIFTEPYRLNTPMILVGLDTIVVGNIDHLADYCMKAERIALPRDPYSPERACNGVSLVPAGKGDVFSTWRGENDMEWIRLQPHVFIDDLFPGHVVSFKGHVRDRQLGDARIVYFHGQQKPHQLLHVGWVRENWL